MPRYHVDATLTVRAVYRADFDVTAADEAAAEKAARDSGNGHDRWVLDEEATSSALDIEITPIIDPPAEPQHD